MIGNVVLQSRESSEKNLKRTIYVRANTHSNLLQVLKPNEFSGHNNHGFETREVAWHPHHVNNVCVQRSSLCVFK